MNENPKNDGSDDAIDSVEETAPVTGLPYAPAAEEVESVSEPVEPVEPVAEPLGAAEPAAEPVAAPVAEPTTVIEPEPVVTSWRHPVNVGHLVMGVAFAGLVVVWALITSDTVDNDEVRWLMPVPWVAAGALGLVATTWSNLRARKARELRVS
ncbi:hypothetical protein ACLM5J_20035 [Nocardioides sp. Bht2]|uniref:hypothetical protein n=1 Tax=Nocardioides sp. Bht2 TaxID=3392297 RepID=UPI0039B44158